MDNTSSSEAETGVQVLDDEITHLCKDVAISVEGMLEKLAPLSAECCIYRIPQKLRKVNQEAYNPIQLSVGPLHRGKKNLAAMEDHKLRYLQNFLIRSNKTLEDCIRIISKQERKIRDSYSESIRLSSKDFVKMILVDGCFIIEVILVNVFNRRQKPNDWIYNKPWLISDVRRDMTLLENQLPFFLLQDLYNLSCSAEKNDCSFLALCIEFFKDSFQLSRFENPHEVAEKIYSFYEIKHFVDLLRVCQLPSKLRSLDDRIKFTVIPTATELHEAGVRFRSIPQDKPLLDIDYGGDGILKIPQLNLQDKSESLFRNVIAFELCHYQDDTYFTDYVYLIDHLINTVEDVDVLVKPGIIENWLGDNIAVANLFNNLLINTTLSRENFYFAGISEDLNNYCEIPWHSWSAILRRDYFSSPWRGASTIAAVILLLLTLIQTIFSCMAAK